MKLIQILSMMLVFLPGTLALAKTEGGELGNAFVPFDSKIGRYSLEYSQDWRLNDLSETTSFADTKLTSDLASFFSVEVDPAGAQSLPELAARLKSLHPSVAWASVKVAGIVGLSGDEKGLRMIYLLRAPGDQILIRSRSVDGPRSEDILSHMLSSFRSE